MSGMDKTVVAYWGGGEVWKITAVAVFGNTVFCSVFYFSLLLVLSGDNV